MTRSARTVVAPYGVVLELATTPKHLDRAQRRYGDEPVGDAESHGFTFTCSHVDYQPGECDCGDGLGGEHVLIYINPRIVKAGGRHLAQTIAHEATHVALFIADRLNIVYDAEHSEPIAYLVDWITGWCWQQIEAKR